MAQYARPNSDVNNNPNWEMNGPATHWDCIDEVTPDGTTTFIKQVVNNQTQECGLSSVSDPNIHTGHIVRVQAWAQPDPGDPNPNLSVNLRQGAGGTPVWSIQYQPDTAGWATNTWTLTETQAGNITDYSALTIDFVSNNIVNGVTAQRVTWAELEVPNVRFRPKVVIL